MNKLTFVSIGDSLTVGYQSSSAEDYLTRPTPYTRFLKEMVERLLKDLNAGDLRVEFRNKGMVGELTEDMLHRFKRDVLDLQPDYVIILGGSNDIGWGIPTQNIVMNLIEMYQKAVEQGIKPIACTVPSILGFDAGILPRIELNQSIEEYCAEQKIICVDLFTDLSDFQTRRLKKDFSNDGLHLNTKGYRAISGKIFSHAVREAITSYYKRINVQRFGV